MQILTRAGYDANNFTFAAVKRYGQFIQRLDDECTNPAWGFHGDDSWESYVLNQQYGTSFVEDPSGSIGKNMNFTKWTHK